MAAGMTARIVPVFVAMPAVDHHGSDMSCVPTAREQRKTEV